MSAHQDCTRCLTQGGERSTQSRAADAGKVMATLEGASDDVRVTAVTTGGRRNGREKCVALNHDSISFTALTELCLPNLNFKSATRQSRRWCHKKQTCSAHAAAFYGTLLRKFDGTDEDKPKVVVVSRSVIASIDTRRLPREIHRSESLYRAK